MAILAPTLVILRATVNSRWPNRSKASDGWIGDPAHQATVSDHNPNSRGVVCAIDITVDGIDPMAVVEAAKAHPSTNYIIYNRVIWTRSGNGWQANRYTGSNPHDKHVHVSIKQTVAAENNQTPWNLGGGGSTPAPSTGTWQTRLAASLPEIKAGGQALASVKRVQRFLNIDAAGLAVDGVFGPATTAAVKRFQGAKGLTADGIVGPKTWGALLGAMSTVQRTSTGLDVKHVQALLNVFGYGVTVDGDFGPATQAAVKAFQTASGLTADGIVGPLTWQALMTR